MVDLMGVDIHGSYNYGQVNVMSSIKGWTKVIAFRQRQVLENLAARIIDNNDAKSKRQRFQKEQTGKIMNGTEIAQYYRTVFVCRYGQSGSG